MWKKLKNRQFIIVLLELSERWIERIITMREFLNFTFCSQNFCKFFSFQERYRLESLTSLEILYESRKRNFKNFQTDKTTSKQIQRAKRDIQKAIYDFIDQSIQSISLNAKINPFRLYELKCLLLIALRCIRNKFKKAQKEAKSEYIYKLVKLN